MKIIFDSNDIRFIHMPFDLGTFLEIRSEGEYYRGLLKEVAHSEDRFSIIQYNGETIWFYYSFVECMQVSNK